jgi:DNA-binding PadR family transcriptional regulator
MPGRRFGFEFQGGGEGWTPPWLRDEEHEHGHGREHGHGHGPQAFAMHHRRGPFGGGPFGFGFGFGPGEGPRVFGRGDIKFALLELLQERPMHGYEMMKALEEKSGGFYSPSPGSIYPTLQMLEDRGFVTVQDVEGKKVYSITDTGRALLAERQKSSEEFAGPPWMRHRGPGRPRFAPEMQALKGEVVEVVRLLTIAGRMSFQDPQQLTRLRSVIERTRKDLSDMIYTPGGQEGRASSSPAEEKQSDGPTVGNV